MSPADSRLLVVDDDEAVRDSLVTWLEGSGYIVSQAGSGREALARCRQHLPELMLCDVHMPEMSGLQLLEVLAVEFPDLPVIIVSGEGEMADVIQALKLGAWDYITKPVVDLEMMEHAVEKSLERARLLRENRAYQHHLEIANQQLKEALDTMRADEEAGSELQQNLFPKNGRRIGDFEFHYLTAPSSSLSGDFLDYFPIDASHIGFYLADVSGHGIASALVTVILENTVSRFRHDVITQQDDILLDPRHTISRLNTLLCGSKMRKHIAMFYGVIDTESHTLSYASAGHYPHTLLFDGDRARFEGYKSPPIGLFKGAEYHNRQCPLDQVGQILLASDGIFDAMTSPRQLEEKEAALLSALARRDTNIDEFINALGVRPDASLVDDLTILQIRSLS